jgi:hypothetical protein
VASFLPFVGRIDRPDHPNPVPNHSTVQLVTTVTPGELLRLSHVNLRRAQSSSFTDISMSLASLQRRGLDSASVFSSNQHPRKPVTTFQAPSIDRLHGHLGLRFGDHDSQIAVTLGTEKFSGFYGIL